MMLNNAKDLNDLRVPPGQVRPWKRSQGNREGQYSIRIMPTVA